MIIVDVDVEERSPIARFGEDGRKTTKPFEIKENDLYSKACKE